MYVDASYMGDTLLVSSAVLALHRCRCTAINRVWVGPRCAEHPLSQDLRLLHTTREKI